MTRRNKPDFYLLGAPESGVTEISQFLQTKASVFVPKSFPSNYFADDLAINTDKARDISQYHALFSEAMDQQKSAEPACFYLYSSSALKNIKEYHSEAKFIVVLNNPVDIVFSYFKDLIAKQQEDQRDFQSAWNLQLERKQGLKLPEECQEPKLLQYYFIGKVGSQLEKLYQLFPSDQVLLILYEDFKKAPESSFQQMIDFLGIADKTKYSSSENEIFKGLQHWSKMGKVGLKKCLDLFYSKPETLLFDETFRVQLTRLYEPEIEKMAHFLMRDLGHWSEI